MSADQLKNLTDIPLAIAAIVLVVYVLRFIRDTTRDNLKALADRDCRYEEVLKHLADVVAANTEAMKTVAQQLNSYGDRVDERTKLIIAVNDDTHYIRKKLDEHHGYVVKRGE